MGPSHFFKRQDRDEEPKNTTSTKTGRRVWDLRTIFWSEFLVGIFLRSVFSKYCLLHPSSSLGARRLTKAPRGRVWNFRTIFWSEFLVGIFFHSIFSKYRLLHSSSDDDARRETKNERGVYAPNNGRFFESCW